MTTESLHRHTKWSVLGHVGQMCQRRQCVLLSEPCLSVSTWNRHFGPFRDVIQAVQGHRVEGGWKSASWSAVVLFLGLLLFGLSGHLLDKHKDTHRWLLWTKHSSHMKREDSFNTSLSACWLTSLPSSIRTASCVFLLSSWLMCFMGLVRASAYSESQHAHGKSFNNRWETSRKIYPFDLSTMK